MASATRGSVEPAQGRARRAWTRAAPRRLRTLPGLLVAFACAGELARVPDGFESLRYGYRIGVPDGPGGPWERIDVDGAVLAFRRPGPQTLTLQRRCGRPVADPAIMARHLVIGLRGRAPLQSGPVQIAGRDAWTQTFETAEEGVMVRVKTVTLVERDCTYDWVLAAAGSFEEAEGAFDAWWQSFLLLASDGDG